MNLASFYLCFFMNINTSAIEAALKRYIVRNEGNSMYKYLVASYTHHFRNDLLSLFFFFLASLFLGNLRHEAQVFIHTRLLGVNTITWMSKKNQLCVRLLKL